MKEESGKVAKSVPKRVGYASIQNVIKTFSCHREGKLPEIVGIPLSDASPVIQSLRSMNLLSRTNHPTKLFDNLVQASENEYRKILTEIIKSTYSEVFTYIEDLTSVTQKQLYQAFGSYALPKQHRKMVGLFKGLCREAGMNEAEPNPSENYIDDQTLTLPTILSQEPVSTEVKRLNQDIQNQQIVSQYPDYTLIRTRAYAFLEALAQQMPTSNKWTIEHKGLWIKALNATYEIIMNGVEQENKYE